MVTGLNHITLATDTLTESIEFYSLLGFEPHVRWSLGAYLSLNDLWLCLAVGEVDAKYDYSHIAFSVNDEAFAKLSSGQKLSHIRQWKKNTSEGKSLYLLDPSGHKLELHVGGLESRLRELREQPYDGLVWLKDEV